MTRGKFPAPTLASQDKGPEDRDAIRGVSGCRPDCRIPSFFPGAIQAGERTPPAVEFLRGGGGRGNISTLGSEMLNIINEAPARAAGRGPRNGGGSCVRQ